MSKVSVQQVIQKAVSDAAFRRQLQREPAKALAGFDLTADERGAVTSGDPTRLTALGVDQRMSKAFAIGAADGASKSIVGDVGTAGTAAFIDDSASGATRGLVGDTTTGAAGASVGDATSGTAIWETDPLTGIPMQDDNSGLRAAEASSGDAASGAAVWETDPLTGIQMQDDSSGFRATDAFESDASSGSASLDGAIPGTSAAGIVDDGDTGGVVPTLEDSSVDTTGDDIRPSEY
jgi:hypothetical protein